jgi:cytochrome c peroxidase
MCYSAHLKWGAATHGCKKMSGVIPNTGKYLKIFCRSLPRPNKQTQVIATAIAAYVNSLSPMDSPFDRYLRGDKQAMTDTQIKGFNLFMGKAQCGTCHFPPYFNALLPPLFDVSETEVLGTPLTDQLHAPTNDNDLGRYDLYQIRFYRQAFKTPTVRNAQKTAPYMHNGAFNTLETVLDFYNKVEDMALVLKQKHRHFLIRLLILRRQRCTKLSNS